MKHKSVVVLVMLLSASVAGVAADKRPAVIDVQNRPVLTGALDRAGAAREADSPMLWYDASALTLEGKGWKDTDTTYSRLPSRARDIATSAVWWLSHNSAGLAVRFVADSTTIGAAWDGSREYPMNHMAATGSAGLDLYERCGDEWIYRGTGRPEQKRTVGMIARNLPSSPTEYLLYLPLYHPVTGLKIGIDPGASIAPAPPRPAGRNRPIVFYGTSITQGGCASRAGMCHVAILGRWLGRETINLGFSGSGKLEPELAPLLAEIDAEAFVIESLPNMNREQVAERVAPAARILRAKHPGMHILLVENPLCARNAPQNVTLRKVFEQLQKEGVKQIYLLPADKQLAGRENGTVDGVHPTDLGFLRMAEAYMPVMRQMLPR
ncbi:MAG: SGNH/GDSL hydrolase family protein [bacterium]